MATIEGRIAALEQFHSDNSISVFLLRWADEVPITKATHGNLSWYKRPDESQGDFEERLVREARKLPRAGAVRVFCLWLSAGESVAENTVGANT